MCRCIVPYLHVIALCIVHLPPLVNVPVHTCYYYDSACLIMSGVECSHDHDCDHHVLIVSCVPKNVTPFSFHYDKNTCFHGDDTSR